MTERVDCVVVGAGVVGLAVARRLALSGRDVLVLEAERQIGSHTSSRNSEVIHAGIYYPQGSLKARLCVAGKRALYRYCRDRGVPHAKLGKLIVGNGERDLTTLRKLLEQGRKNGVGDLEWLNAGEVAGLEPEIRANAAILSPSTGIVDSHALMLALEADLEASGGSVLLKHRVVRLEVRGGRLVLVAEADDRFSVSVHTLVNSAGLWASSLIASIDGLENLTVRKTRYAKGHYFDYGKSPFERLIYPVPIVGGLGIHATNDLSGQLRFGPDAEWVSAIDYAFEDTRRGAFVAAIERYFPSVDGERLSPAYTGIRPKLYRPEDTPSDFVIEGPGTHGIPGLINLLGIESPGLTACLAIADYVHELARDPVLKTRH